MGMEKRELKLDGPGVKGVRVDAALLRDVLSLTIEGAQRALRLRMQGRSTASGPVPRLVSSAADFVVSIRKGSTVLEIEAPTLREADPEYFAQEDLYPDVSPDLTSYDYLAQTFNDALHSPEASAIDMQMVQLLARYKKVFDHGLTSLEFGCLKGALGSNSVLVRERDVKDLRKLEKQIPPPQAVRLAGKLDLIKHSDGAFTIELPNGEKVKGIVSGDRRDDLQELWGESALVIGVAHFGPSRKVVRVEAQIVRSATEIDHQLWAFPPEPQVSERSEALQYRVAQGPRSGFNAIFGQWPGDEGDEEIAEILERLS